MARKNTHSLVLRQLAEQLVDRVSTELGFEGEQRDEIVTSLVRQWLTYDGHAALFIEDRQFYLDIARTPLGKPVVVPEPALHGWTRQLIEEWKISPEDLPEVFEQLNRGQSAEAVNLDGVPLRLRVDPKERCRGVEPLVQEKVPPGFKKDYRRIAFVGLEQQLGEGLDHAELDALARSVAAQWQRFGGHASIFVDAGEEIVFKIIEVDGGGNRVDAGRRFVNLRETLAPFHFPHEAMPEVIARFNLGHELEFQDSKGIRCRLHYDPRLARFIVERVHIPPPAEKSAVAPLICPYCTAVLMPWREGQRRQSCPICGGSVTLR